MLVWWQLFRLLWLRVFLVTCFLTFPLARINIVIVRSFFNLHGCCSWTRFDEINLWRSGLVEGWSTYRNRNCSNRVNYSCWWCFSFKYVGSLCRIILSSDYLCYCCLISFWRWLDLLRLSILRSIIIVSLFKRWNICRFFNFHRSIIYFTFFVSQIVSAIHSLARFPLLQWYLFIHFLNAFVSSFFWFVLFYKPHNHVLRTHKKQQNKSKNPKLFYFFLDDNFGDNLLAWDNPLFAIFCEGFLLCVGDFSEDFLVFIRLFDIWESKRRNPLSALFRIALPLL